MNFPNYTQLYTIVEAIANAISRKKADLVPNELTEEEMENLRNIFMPASVTVAFPHEYVYDWNGLDNEEWIRENLFNTNNDLYISQVEYSNEQDVSDPSEATSWSILELNTPHSLGGRAMFRITVCGSKSALSDNERVHEFAYDFVRMMRVD